MVHLSTPSLPNELLVLIFSHFCLHCQDAYNESWDQRLLQPLTYQQKKQEAGANPWYSIDRQTLCSLSLTCRQFRDVAQSILYHEFVFGYGHSWISEVYRWEDRLAPFIRTLARRPDLARLVKVICISHCIFSTSGDNEEFCRNILREATQALGVDLPAAWKQRLDDAGLICPWEEQQLQKAMTEKSMCGHRWMNAQLIAILLAHTRNVQHVSIQSSRGWPTCGFPKSSMSALGVTHLRVTRLDLGMPASSLIRISGNLEILNLHGNIGDLGVSKIEMPCLKTLRITDGFLTAERLSNPLGGCTGGLVAFEYEAAEGRHYNSDARAVNFLLSDAIESLELHKSTLQIFHLDLVALREETITVKPGLTMRDFTALQHVSINTRLLFPLIRGEPADPEILVEFLPHSIVSLGAYRDVRPWAIDSLHRLAVVKNHKFPFLKWVVSGPRGDGMLERKFKATGVNFSNKVHHLCQVRPYLQGPNTDSRREFPAYDSEDEFWSEEQ